MSGDGVRCEMFSRLICFADFAASKSGTCGHDLEDGGGIHSEGVFFRRRYGSHFAVQVTVS